MLRRLNSTGGRIAGFSPLLGLFALTCILSLTFPQTAQALPKPRIKVTSSQNQVTLKATFRRWKRKFKKNRIHVQTSIDGSGYAQFANLGGRKRTLLRFSALTSGTYSFRARAVDTLGRTSPWSAPQTITVRVATPAPPPENNDPPNTSIPWPELTTGLSECPAGVEDVILVKVNEERAAAGVHPLERRYELDVASRVHSIWMAENLNMSHDGWFDEIQATGLEGRHFSQNIARFISDPAILVDAWMSSEYHARNILNQKDTMTGISCVIAANGQMYWTQDFGG